MPRSNYESPGGLTVAAAALAYAPLGAGGGVFGDGSDGNVTISGGTTTLTRDMFYDTLTIASGGTLKPAGYRVFCKTACDIQTGGLFLYDGNAAAAAVAGAIHTTTGVQGGKAGGAGGTGAGTAGSASNTGFGGNGGAGGLGSSGAGAAGGTTTNPGGGNSAGFRYATAAILGELLSAQFGWVVQAGGSGGGSGGGDGTGSGGGGGGGGGFIVLAALVLNIDGTLRARGGAGGDGGGTNCGGGGGGGGGVLNLIYRSKTGTGATLTAATNVPGGAGGAKTGTGVAGSTGANGTIFEVVS